MKKRKIKDCFDKDGNFIKPLLNFLGSILSVFKFKVVGNKFEVAYGKTNNN